MKILLFELSGDMAMWRNVYEPMGSYSCLGPAPSNLAGLIGAALGFASPRSQAAKKPDVDQLKNQDKAGLPWPLSPELLAWEEMYDFHVACRWIGGFPKRVPWNVNGCKEINSSENLRLQQQVILDPAYEVAVKLPPEEAERVAAALRKPAFPLCLGASFCRAIVRNVRFADSVLESQPWAFQSPKDIGILGEATPFSQHIVNPDSCFGRICSNGYWIYPTEEPTEESKGDPLVPSWRKMDPKPDGKSPDQG